MLEAAREARKMASTVFAYETSTSFVFVCRNVCEPRTRVVFSVCVCQMCQCNRSSWLCVRVWVILKFALALQLSTSVTAPAPNNTDHTRICPLRDSEKWKKLKRKGIFFFFFFFFCLCMSNWDKMICGHWHGIPILNNNKIINVSSFWRTHTFSCYLWNNFCVI